MQPRPTTNADDRVRAFIDIGDSTPEELAAELRGFGFAVDTPPDQARK